MQWMLTLPLLPDSIETLTQAVCCHDAPPPAPHVESSLQVGWGKATLSALLSQLAKGPLLVDVASAATGVLLIYVCIYTYVLRPNSPTHTIYYVLTLQKTS
jgi:hypothetical protein